MECLELHQEARDVGAKEAPPPDAARVRCDLELAEAEKALKAAVPGSVVASWIERRVSNARKALDDLNEQSSADIPREKRLASLVVDVSRPALAVEVDNKGPLSLASPSLLSPATQTWFSQPSSLVEESTVRSWSVEAESSTDATPTGTALSAGQNTPGSRKRLLPETARASEQRPSKLRESS